MKEKKAPQITKEIKESLKAKITGEKTASFVTVLVVIVILVIVAVIGKFGEYIGTNRIFPKWANSLFQDEKTDKSKLALTDIMESEQNTWSVDPSETNVVPAQIYTARNTSENRNETPTIKEGNSGDTISESLTSSIDLQSNVEFSSIDETENPTNTISVSCIPVEFSFTDKNAEIRAVTSFEATNVVLICEANGTEYGRWNMRTADSHVWTFNANFYESNIYTLTVIAYDSNGEQARDFIDVKYPFY